ncbi:hypothetical protein KJ866_02310 [Patescibacteria group bacterium]|nr:hypothetical protein [Patescibacteria group bacterium]
MEKMTFLEVSIYAILLFADYAIVWQIAKNGFLEIGIERPINMKAIGATMLGILTLVAAGFIERAGYVKLLLAREENLFWAAVVFAGSPLILFLLVRFVLLPKGLPEYNRARISMVFWAMSNYQPGVKMAEKGEGLANFHRAQQALKFFEKAIEAQSRGSSQILITRTYQIDHEQTAWDGRMNLNCPNCGFRAKAPIQQEQGDGYCPMCGCRLAFKVMGDEVHVTAFGSGLYNKVSPRHKKNIATAYEEMALLLRMMNKFAEARKALTAAEKFIDELLAEDPDDKECLAIKSLIIFRKGEIAQTLNERVDAKRFYQESLALDSKTGDHKGDQLVKRLIEEVS